jgi:predicted DNA-binding transcriptional regulator YafY
VKTDLSPTARALRALELLQAQPGITNGQLAVQLEVTERAVRRYVAILREAGIPFHVEGGPELHAAVAAVTARLTAALGAAPDNERSPRTRPQAG